MATEGKSRPELNYRLGTRSLLTCFYGVNAAWPYLKVAATNAEQIAPGKSAPSGSWS